MGARLERIGQLTREGASRPELLEAIRGLLAEGVKSSTDVSDEAAAGALADGKAPSGGGTAASRGPASAAFARKGGVAVS